MFFLPPPLLHSPTVPTPPKSTSTLCSHLTQPVRSAAPNAPLLLALHSVPTLQTMSLHVFPSPSQSHRSMPASSDSPLPSAYPSFLFSLFIFLHRSALPTLLHPRPLYPTSCYPCSLSPITHCAHWVLSLPFSTINHHVSTECLLILTLSTQPHYMPCIFGSLTLLEHFLNVVTSWPFFLPSLIPTDSPNAHFLNSLRVLISFFLNNFFFLKKCFGFYVCACVSLCALYI